MAKTRDQILEEAIDHKLQRKSLGELMSDVDPITDAFIEGANSRNDELVEKDARINDLEEEKLQWEPQWRSEAEANAAGYNQALDKIRSLQTKLECAVEALKECQNYTVHDTDFLNGKVITKTYNPAAVALLKIESMGKE